MSSVEVNRLRGRPGWRTASLAAFLIVVGILVGFAPFGRAWEEDLGLDWLFRLRGPVQPPQDVAIVTMDRASSDHLGVPNNPRKWPRDLHARLLDRLGDAGASVVAFDVMFQEPRDPTEDLAFASAVHGAGNVVLFEYLSKDILPMSPEGAHGPGEVVVERRIPPIPALAEAARGLAPFALPRVPIKVSQVWLFKPGAGDAPTLPVVALQTHAAGAFGALLALIRKLDADAYRRYLQLTGSGKNPVAPVRADIEVRALRRLLRDDRSLTARLFRHLGRRSEASTTTSKQMIALVAAFSGEHSLHVNFYGPPRSIRTIPYHKVLGRDTLPDLELSGRAVFVGMAERLQPEQRDGFYTAFTKGSGLDISGVEIAATTFANLLYGEAIEPLPPRGELLLLLGWALLLATLLRALPGGWIPIASIGMAGAYLALATTAFNHANLWLPLVTPLLVQGTLATFGALLLRYRDVHRERENIRRAFGMHLPISIVDQLAQGIDSFNASSERAFGVCLATDAEQYTMLAERLEPAALRQFMNAYYEAVFAPVKRHGGVVTDVVGDSMLAIWAGGTDTPELRIKACRAALELLTVVHEFNERSPQHRLPVRAGVHCGELVLGHVGAADHYEYRAVGDIVNTASRIEGLSKQLGTRLLASEEVVTGLPGLYTRALGSFILKGKTRPVSIHELMSGGDVDQIQALKQAFAEALHAFTAGEWAEAQERFSTIQRAHGNDGPSAFYGKLCRRYLAAHPRKDWNGVVTLTSK